MVFVGQFLDDKCKLKAETSQSARRTCCRHNIIESLELFGRTINIHASPRRIPNLDNFHGNGYIFQECDRSTITLKKGTTHRVS